MRRTRVMAAALALLAGNLASAQELPIPEEARQDRAGLEQALPGLATQARRLLPQDPLRREEYLFHIELAEGRYSQALAALAAWEKQRDPPPIPETVKPQLRQELHARARVLAASAGIPYDESFSKSLDAHFASLSDRAAADSAWMLGLPPVAARANLDRTLDALKGRPHITLVELIDALRWRGILEATSSYAPVLAGAIAVDDARRFVIDRGVLIRTKHGATIAADVVRPRRTKGPLPAVLHFTIYANPDINLRDAKDAAVRGFAGVFAHSRGKYLSTDRIVPWETEALDTREVIDWISRQPWNDGKVGMFGHSYAGFAQWAALKNRHPALRTIVPSSASFPGNGLPLQNGVFLNANYGWPLQFTSDRFMGDATLADPNRWFPLLVKWFESGRPLRDIDAIDGTPNPVLQRQLRHPVHDAYWAAMQPHGEEFARIDIPVLTLTGYFDDAGSAAVNHLVDHYRHDPDAEHYLVIGPYDHLGVLGTWRDPRVRGYEMDPVAQIDTLDLVYGWLGHVLRGDPKPALLRDRINFQVMGANTWDHAPSIERMADRRLRLHLGSEKVAGRHVLSPRRPASGEFLEQTVDLADRTTWLSLYPGNAWLDSPDAPTHLTFVSAPFEAPCRVSGLVTGELHAAIDRRDFDFTWSLYEAMPDGRYFNLAYYLGRASHAADATKRELLTPGEITALPFSQTPLVARQLSAGSRLALLLTVNKNPFAQVNHGTGKDVSDETSADAARPLHVRWYDTSHIDVPLRGCEAP